MLNKLRNYINDNSFKMNVCDHTVNIINYIDIIILEENRVSLKHRNGIITIIGDKLSVNKMLDKEMLITGDFKSIEFK